MTLAYADVAESPTVQAGRTVPFDYAFRFVLEGTPGKTARKKITISVEAGFTAVSVGYGVIPTQPIRFGAAAKTLGTISIGDLAASLDAKAPGARDLVFRTGFRLNPQINFLLLNRPLAADVLDEAFETIPTPPDRVQFTYALFDDGSGREFQSEPILNIAGLGSADGARPFRYFARPIVFAPMSVIRMEITEIQTVKGELHVSLHGYKTLGDQAAAQGAPSLERGRARRRR